MRLSAEERFWSKVDKRASCWTWTAGKSADGYGNFKFEGRDVKAHRFAYETERGTIPAGLQLDHLCRNRDCVNPEHLQAVTQRTNVLRGEGVSADRARQTHCKRGHLLDEGNTYRWRTSRICRTCRTLAAKGR